MDATVVIPAYNAAPTLPVVLASLEAQLRSGYSWEVIVVDDGSGDDTAQACNPFSHKFALSTIVTCNRGRSAARNEGIRASRGRVLIFCDADRPVAPNFITAHLTRQCRTAGVVVGCVMELYVKRLEPSQFVAFATRASDSPPLKPVIPRYPQTVYSMFDSDGNTGFSIPWIAFFSGNVSVQKDALIRTGAFDEDFRGWGFEHFELGYRLFKCNTHFAYSKDAINYHIAHARHPGSYEKEIASSYEHFRAKAGLDVAPLLPFMQGRISLEEFDFLARHPGDSNVKCVEPKTFYTEIPLLKHL